MKTFEVDIFVLGCSPELTKRTVTIEADSQDEAERLAISGGLMSGYGVIDSREV